MGTFDSRQDWLDAKQLENESVPLLDVEQTIANVIEGIHAAAQSRCCKITNFCFF